MTVGFTATGTFSGRTILSYPEGPAYVDNYSGSSSDEGSITYTSPTAGHGTIHGSGSGSGVDNYHPDGGDFLAYSFNYTGNGDLDDDNGSLTRANAHGTSTTATGGTPYTLNTVGTVDVSSVPYQARTTWSFPVHDEFGGVGTSSGSWNGSITPTAEEPFDIEVYAASWMSFGGAVFSFATNGRPYPTSTRSTPVAKVEVFWAQGENEESIIGESLGEVPVYWNQANGGGSFEPLGDIPEEARYLLIVADHAHELDEPNRGNNVFFLEIYQDPTVEIFVDPEGPDKGDNYDVTVKVTNNSAVPMVLNLDWEEIYPDNAAAIGLVPNQPATDTKSTGELQSQETREFKLRTLNHYWRWIPTSNPINGEAIIGRVIRGIESIKVKELAQGSARILGFLRDLSTINTAFSVLQQLASANEKIHVPVEVTAADEDELVSTTEHEDVLLTVPLEYQTAFLAFVAANTTANVALSKGMSLLVSGNIPWATVVLGGAAGLYIIAGNAYNKAIDPPDPNYTVLALPQRLPVDGMEVQPTTFDSLRAFDALDLNALSTAETRSRDRADGAKLAADWDWQSQQLLRASDFASQTALFYTRQIARGVLNEPFEIQVGGITPADIVASLQTAGMPAVVVDVLTEAGWTPARIESLRQNLIASGPDLWPQADEGRMDQLGAMNAGAAGLEQLEQAISIRVDQLGAPVRALTVAERDALDQQLSEIDLTFEAGVPSLTALARIQAMITDTRRLLLETNNVEALHDDLEYAYGALSDFQKYDWTPQGLQDTVDALEAAGSIGGALADELRMIAEGTAAELVAGDFVEAGRSLTSFVYAVREAGGVTPAVRKELEDYPLLLRDFLDPFPWQNDLNPLHVDGDAAISPIDALTVINWLNGDRGQDVPSPLDTLIVPHAQIDTSGDNKISPLDALLVINWLNNPFVEMEGEQLSQGGDEAKTIPHVRGLDLLGNEFQESELKTTLSDNSCRENDSYLARPWRLVEWIPLWQLLTSASGASQLADAPVRSCMTPDEVDALLADWDGLTLGSLLEL